MQTVMFAGIMPETVWTPPVKSGGVAYCENCRELVSRDNIKTQSGMCQKCHDANVVQCTQCNVQVHASQANSIDGEPLCESCCRCHICGNSDVSRLEYETNGNIACNVCQTNTLEVRGNRVYSDDGNYVPLWDVKKTVADLLNVMKKARGTRQRWKPKTGMVWGGYGVHYVDTNGGLHVGCNKFSIREIERFIKVENI